MAISKGTVTLRIDIAEAQHVSGRLGQNLGKESALNTGSAGQMEQQIKAAQTEIPLVLPIGNLRSRLAADVDRFASSETV